MAVLMSLGGAPSDGFLIAPLGTTYDAEISLSTDAGTLNVTLQAAAPNPAGLVFSTMGPIAISTVPTIVKVHSTLQSTMRGDTTIQVRDGAMTVVASFKVTSIKHPVVNFRGRFEVRFATDESPPFLDPIYPAPPGTDTAVDSSPGWTWALEGEPDFAPAPPLPLLVPENLETPGMGRVVRFNNPMSLRPLGPPASKTGFVPAVASLVDSISGQTSSRTETFTAGDPLIGQQVDLGPDTYLAGNEPPDSLFSTPTGGAGWPEEMWEDGYEPMALFELHLGTLFSGASKVGPFVAKTTVIPTSTMVGQNTRHPDSRPFANGLVATTAGPTNELSQFGLPDLKTFSETRVDQLVIDYNALPAGPSPQRRNLARRIGHLLGYLSTVDPAKVTAVQSANPGAFYLRTATIPVAWDHMEVYTGYVDTNLVFNPAGSIVIAYLSAFNLFKFQERMFAFHSDELCGYHIGSLEAHVNSGGTYTGDPHTHTVDGTNYDFQGVGEFTLLRDSDKMEIQVRQTPVATANPATDSHSGLTACVSVITAIAARVGSHRIAFQPEREGHQLQFYLDGKPGSLPVNGIDLGGSRVTVFDANGETGLRIDYADQTVVVATPTFWASQKVWYIDVTVSNTQANEGIMGFIPKDSWLPRLRNGTDVGPMPASLHDRYVTLYRTFANSWLVTDKTSLFVYAPGTSTKTFTDVDWPAEKAPCKLKPQFHVPGVSIAKSMPIAQAKQICRAVSDRGLYNSCVFDVATTGDEIFVKSFLTVQEIGLCGTAIQIEGREPPKFRTDRKPITEPAKPPIQTHGSLVVMVTVLPLTEGRPTPTGSVTFVVDDVPMKRPVELDGGGRARITVTGMKPGDHKIRATYSGGGKYNYHSSASPNLLYTVAPAANDRHNRNRAKNRKRAKDRDRVKKRKR